MPPPGDTPRSPPPAPVVTPSVSAGPRVSYVQKYVVLLDWWLERVEGDEGKIRVAGIPFTNQMRKGASSSKGNRKGPARVFRSATIVRRHHYNDIETKDGFLIRIGCPLNMPRTRENGFPDKVCEWFEFGFPVQWQKLANPIIEPENDHAQSPSNHAQSPSKSTANAPGHAIEYYMEKFSSKDFLTNPMNYACTNIGFNSSSRYSSNTDGPAIQMGASLGLCDGTMDMPEEPLAPPGGTCSSGQLSDLHESIRIDASEQEIVNQSIRSVPLGQSTGSVCANSKVDGNISASSKVVSVTKEGCRSRLGFGQAEQDADIQHMNMENCSSELETVTPSTNGTLRCGKISVSLEIVHALEAPTKGMTSQSGAVRGSEDNPVRRLRSGKVFGIPSSASMKTGHKRKRVQHEASNKKMVPNEGATPNADLTHNENGSSAPGTVAEDKHQSHDPQRKGPGRPANKRGDNSKLAKKRRDISKLFCNWV